MKRNFITSLIVSLVMLIGCCAIPMSASASEEPTTIVSTEYFEDGSYIVTTLTLPNNKARSTKPASKTSTARNSSGTALWSYTLSATFTYDGNDSKCTSVSDSYTIYDSNWYKHSSSCGKDGNYAFGTIVMKKKTLGVVVDTVTKSLNLSCDKYGNIV